MIRTRYVIEYAALRGTAGLLNALPYRLALALAWVLAALVFRLSRYRARLAETRMLEVFGDRYSAAARRRLAWRAWRNFVFCAVDLVRLRHVTQDWVWKHVEGCQIACDKLAAHTGTGQGAVLACPHMGAWEVAGVTAQQLGVPIFFLAGRQKNPLADAYINRCRARTGIDTVLRGSSMLKSVIRRLRQGGVLAFPPDVRVPTPGPTVMFLGRPANLVGGMAMFARQAGVPIFPVIVTRKSWTQHAVWLGDPVWPDETVDKRQDWQRMTQSVFTVIEEAIRREPEQWFWFNKRWVLDPVDVSPPEQQGGQTLPPEGAQE